MSTTSKLLGTCNDLGLELLQLPSASNGEAAAAECKGLATKDDDDDDDDEEGWEMEMRAASEGPIEAKHVGVAPIRALDDSTATPK
mmetsp:Transcript_2643/g.3485  ORF Transcript_2643/g.3485 Transcript_2643/m.3485 type:complete len:86 (+) Transcript_2643:384-641(+)